MNYVVIELLEMMGKCSIAFAHAKQPPVGWNSIFLQHWLLRGWYFSQNTEVIQLCGFHTHIVYFFMLSKRNSEKKHRNATRH